MPRICLRCSSGLKVSTGAFLFPDLAREAQSPSGFQAGVFEGLKFLAWESRQVGGVRRYQGADKVETTAVEELLIAGRAVPYQRPR